MNINTHTHTHTHTLVCGIHNRGLAYGRMRARPIIDSVDQLLQFHQKNVTGIFNPFNHGSLEGRLIIV